MKKAIFLILAAATIYGALYLMLWLRPIIGTEPAIALPFLLSAFVLFIIEKVVADKAIEDEYAGPAGCTLTLLVFTVISLTVIDWMKDRKVAACYPDGSLGLVSPFYPFFPIRYSTAQAVHIEKLDSVLDIWRLEKANGKYDVVKYNFFDGATTVVTDADSLHVVEKSYNAGNMYGIRYCKDSVWKTTDLYGYDMGDPGYEPNAYSTPPAEVTGL